jgi:transcriptional regulator with XRE-family HTH domain
MLSASAVSRVESGRRQPASSALNHIAERLGVDTGFLRDGIDAEVRRRARLARAGAAKLHPS